MVLKQAKDPKFSKPAIEVAVYKQTPDLNLLHPDTPHNCMLADVVGFWRNMQQFTITK